MQNHVNVRFSRLAMAQLERWILILSLFLLVTSPGYSQDVLWGLAGYNGPKGAGTAFSLETTGANFQIRKAFYHPSLLPHGSLVQGADGAFYGLTLEGGNNNYGTVFKMEADGTFTKLKDFNDLDGIHPKGNLVQGADGFFYGMTPEGGNNNYGTVFKMEANGTFTKLKDFNDLDGTHPKGSLGQGTDGFFYGMTSEGGNFNYGTVFKMKADGTFMKLKDFDYSDGTHPKGSLVQGTDGAFYGMTSKGGNFDAGTVFKMEADGTFTKLKDFDYSDGARPEGSLVQGTDGFFYGMTSEGGSFGYGTVFKMDPNGTLLILQNFDLSLGTGIYPHGSLMQGTDGFLYGMTTRGGIDLGNGTVFKIAPDGTFVTLKSFAIFDGDQPQGSLVQGTDGFFYGLTLKGGKANVGTAFKIDAKGTFTSLYTFGTSDGVEPTGSLILGKDGAYYGLTKYGSVGNFYTSEGYGTIFKIEADNTFTTLKNFDNFNSSDGFNPSGSLVQGSDGAFYGMATEGGINYDGSIFKLTADGTFTTLKDFNYLIADGIKPLGSLVQGTDGFFYGMTSSGGSYGNGTIFKIDVGGTFTKLKDFSQLDGANPHGSLVQGTDGFFYGMTTNGGSKDGAGTVFKIASDGTFTKLKDFDHSDGNGASPRGSLVQGTDGFFYGMTTQGGYDGAGTIFKMDAKGTFTTLKRFNYSDGGNPYGSLVQGTDGLFYGMTSSGGSFLSGTIFKIDGEGNFTSLRHLNHSDGTSPYGSLIIQKNPIAGCTASGFITREQYTFDLTGKPVVSTLTSLEATNQGDFFVARIMGYICPPQTGNYTFWISGDDATRLTLSPNADPAQAKLLAYSFNPTNLQEYTKNSSQQSAPVYLEAGRKYYIEAQHAALGSDDYVSVAWQLPNGLVESPIPGSRLSPYVNDGKGTVALATNKSSFRTQLKDLHQAVVTPIKGLRISPNPFYDRTWIDYEATQSGALRLELFTTTGKLLRTLYRGHVNAGNRQQYVLEESGLAAGVYVCRVTLNNKTEHTRILLIK